MTDAIAFWDMSLRLLHSSIEITIIRPAMVALVGPPAMDICKPRQARKGATVAETSCAGVWLMRVATNSFFFCLLPDQADWILSLNIRRERLAGASIIISVAVLICLNKLPESPHLRIMLAFDLPYFIEANKR